MIESDPYYYIESCEELTNRIRTLLITMNNTYKQEEWEKLLPSILQNYELKFSQISKTINTSLKKTPKIHPGNFYHPVKRSIKKTNHGDVYYLQYLGDENIDKVNKAYKELEEIKIGKDEKSLNLENNEVDKEVKGRKRRSNGEAGNKRNHLSKKKVNIPDNIFANACLVSAIKDTSSEMPDGNSIKRIITIKRKFNSMYKEGEIQNFELKFLQKLVDRYVQKEVTFFHLSCEDWEEKNFKSIIKLYQVFYCSICKLFNCQYHAIEEFKSLPVIKKRKNTDSLCSPHCFKLSELSSRDTNATERNYEIKDKHSILQIYIEGLRERFDDDCCLINKCMKIAFTSGESNYSYQYTCNDLYESLKGRTEKKIEKAQIRKKVKKNRIVKNTMNKERFRNIKEANENQIIHEYAPCSHDNDKLCNNKCPCTKRGFCEKFCKCSSESCTLRFMGCNCSSVCVTSACPCYANGRECDEDLCGKCKHKEYIHREKFYSNENNCRNRASRLRIFRKTAIAESNISGAGWGLFAMEKISKGELINEYTGELIEYDDLEEREVLNNLENTTYIFKLNENYNVDSKYIGNKLRFANHSLLKMNSIPRVIFSSGCHKICLYASRDINKYEEILFDYDGAGTLCKKFPWVNYEKSLNNSKCSKNKPNKNCVKTKNEEKLLPKNRKRLRWENEDLNDSFSKLYIPYKYLLADSGNITKMAESGEDSLNQKKIIFKITKINKV